MKRELPRLIIFSLALALAGSVILSSCIKDKPFGQGEEFAYKAYAIGSEGSQQIVLDKLFGGIRSIQSSAAWLTASDGGTSSDGHPIVTLVNTDGNSGEATVTVTDENSDVAVITVRHRPLDDGDVSSGGNDDFMSAWWVYKEIPLEGFAVPQKAPWTEEGGVTIPDEIRYQYLPDDGWEMAFSYVNNPTMQGVRMFALYNKWTGQMRVFAYIDKPSGWGSEILFRTYFGGSQDNVLYPLYHVFQYGIPVNHVPGQSLLRNAQLIPGQPQTFTAWVSPYRRSDSMQTGWYVMEYDMSGFVPAGQDWLHASRNPRFSFFADTKEDQSITLQGSMIGSLAGEFQDPTVIQHGGTSLLYGISSGLDMLSGMTSSSIASCATYAKLCSMTDPDDDLGNFLNPLKMWSGFAASIASPIIGGLASLSDPITYEDVPGKIDLNLDASIELAGHITSTTSNDFSPLGVSAANIEEANGPDGHLGKGVWGLSEDPVVYVDKDVLLSSRERINFVNLGDNTFSNTDFDSYGLRTLWFFDPSTVKINLNPDVFPDVKEVYLTATCGVYPTRPLGNTDPYRKMLMLKDRPVVDITGGKGVGKLVTLRTSDTTPRLAVLSPEDVVTKARNKYHTVDNCDLIEQEGAGSESPIIRYYGKMEHEMGKDILVDPQVFLPYVKKGDTFHFGAPTVPDLVVAVNIVFESQGRTFHFSKLYIPRIELVGHNQASSIVLDGSISAYTRKSEAGQNTGYVDNMPGVPVYSPDGYAFSGKTMKIYELIR